MKNYTSKDFIDSTKDFLEKAGGRTYHPKRKFVTLHITRERQTEWLNKISNPVKLDKDREDKSKEIEKVFRELISIATQVPEEYLTNVDSEKFKQSLEISKKYDIFY